VVRQTVVQRLVSNDRLTWRHQTVRVAHHTVYCAVKAVLISLQLSSDLAAVTLLHPLHHDRMHHHLYKVHDLALLLIKAKTLFLIKCS
jgi:hypothetical protein